MSKLLIVESPSKAKTIGKYLGKDYVVRASVGHVRDLPKSNKQAIDIEAGFVPHYEISKGKEKVIEEIRSLASEASEVLLATDPDREGEAISWHLKELISKGKSKSIDQKKIKRVVYYEITKEAIEEALRHPRAIDEKLVRAQEARRVLDRLVGYDLSGLIWKKVRYGLSAGRVQSPALRIIMEREREIRAFVPENYWVLEALLENGRKNTFKATCSEEPKNIEEVNKILELGRNGSWIVSNLEESEVKRSPKAPFTTSTLQQAASTRLGLSPSNTMRIAQKLYESGLITYMRTDSTTLSTQAVAQAETVVKKLYGEQYHEIRQYKTKSKNAQEAHEAIRPTNLATQTITSTDDEKKLYSLIWRRTLSSQMCDARMLRSKIIIEVAEGKVPDFTVTGSRLLYEGWLLADSESKGEDTILPIVEHGEKLKLKELTDTAKQTEPPGRYSEAGLIKELEKRGIGRPSTYASIIRTIEERGYVEKLNKALFPTDTGDVVSTFLEKTFADYISDTFTAGMEDKLDNIANGDAEYEKTLSDFYKPFLKEVKLASKNTDKLTTLGEADPKFKCPVCNGPMVIKLSKNGRFLSCAKFPECNGALMMDGTEIKPDEPIGIDPVSGENIFVKTGPYGPYVQLGEAKVSEGSKSKKKIKPRMSSIPKDVNPSDVTIVMAMRYLSLPRDLGIHPVSGEKVISNVGRFGPYVGEARNFRSIKAPQNPYDITFDEAVKLLNEPKKPRGFQKKIKGTEVNK
jgi:DNA topoisomerase-1